MSLLQKVQAALDAVAYPREPEGLYEPIRYALSGGGKRLRPTLTLLSYSLFRDDVEKALPAALALETYHNHTLLHDDLMDRASLRRGRPTVYKKWDANTAVLSGDAMLILAFEHLLSLPPESLAPVARLFAHTAIEVCEGQQLDMNFERRDAVSEAEYIEMIRLKTAVLLACAAKAGAIIAGASERDADALYLFAERLGLAFQLQDDYLDVYGDPAVFGKKIGGDILCAKKTFLLIHAFLAASPAQAAALRACLRPDAPLTDDEKIRTVTLLYDSLGVPQTTLAAIESRFREACDGLSALSLPEERKQELKHYAASLLGRKV